jgi:hypothetical protein
MRPAERSTEWTAWPFIGTWQLVSFESRDESGAAQYPMGRDVLGQLMYDAQGHMSALLAQSNVPPFASEDLHGGTDAELRAAFLGFFGYFGTYSFNLSEGTVMHHIRGATFPNWAGVDQLRFFKAQGEQLALSAPPMRIEGRQVTTTLIWRRT